jgi:hypothetical protein
LSGRVGRCWSSQAGHDIDGVGTADSDKAAAITAFSNACAGPGLSAYEWDPIAGRYVLCEHWAAWAHEHLLLCAFTAARDQVAVSPQTVHAVRRCTYWPTCWMRANGSVHPVLLKAPSAPRQQVPAISTFPVHSSMLLLVEAACCRTACWRRWGSHARELPGAAALGQLPQQQPQAHRMRVWQRPATSSRQPATQRRRGLRQAPSLSQPRAVQRRPAQQRQAWLAARFGQCGL